MKGRQLRQIYANWQIRSWNTLRLLTLDVRITNGFKSGCVIRTVLQPVSKSEGRWYFSHLTAERCRRGIRKWNLPQIRTGQKTRYPGFQVLSLTHFLEALGLKPVHYYHSADHKTVVSHETMPALSPVLDGPTYLFVWWKKHYSLFRTLHNGQTWSSGRVRPSCSYETAGMWLLVWFPQDVTEKTKLTLESR